MIKLLERYFDRSPYLTFLPFGVIYALVVLLLHHDQNLGDELRYLTFTQNLINGYYSPPPPHINLWSGPGYPIIILPLVWLKLPLISITLLNAVFQYLSLVLLYKTLKNYISGRLTIILSLFWACYYPAFVWWMPLIYTESFTILLITMIIYLLSKTKIKSPFTQQKHLILTGILIGFLILTKIAFGYALLLLLIIYLFQFAFSRDLKSKYVLFSLSIALLVNIPYLSYTYSLTHKIFYWGSAGGANLYWMTSPYEGEYGEWHGAELYQPPQSNSQLAENHKEVISRINAMPAIEQDDEFKRIAIQNIKTHPTKYIKNICNNASRMLIDFPIAFASPTGMYPLRILPTCLLFPFALTAFFLALKNIKKLPAELLLAFLLVTIYLGTSLLVSAYNRQLIIVVPVILLFIGYTFEKFLMRSSAQS